MPMDDGQLKQLGFIKFGAFGMPGGYAEIWVLSNSGEDGFSYWKLTLFGKNDNFPVGDGIAPNYQQSLNTVNAAAQLWIESGMSIDELRQKNQPPPDPTDLGFLPRR